jgi:hypothetical protein
LEGEPRLVYLDKELPRSHTQIKYCNELWLGYLEKAVAKVYGSYSALEREFRISEVVEMLTGRPTVVLKHNQGLDSLGNEIVRAAKEGHQISANNEKESYLVKKYCVLSTGEFVILVYNPFGTSSWKGAYSRKSKVWADNKEAYKKLLKTYRDELDDEKLYWLGLEDYA